MKIIISVCFVFIFSAALVAGAAAPRTYSSSEAKAREAAASQNPCVSSARLDESYKKAVDLLTQKSWLAAARKFEEVMASFESPAPAIYAAYSYAKLADFKAVRPLLERAKKDGSCLTSAEKSQLNWLINAYNDATTVPPGYDVSVGGTLSKDAVLYSPMTLQEVNQRHSEEVAYCDQDGYFSTRRSSDAREKCLNEADEKFKNSMYRLRDPCGLRDMKADEREDVENCIKRYQARASGVYDPLKSKMPGFK